jgi:hypothetical protein
MYLNFPYSRRASHLQTSSQGTPNSSSGTDLDPAFVKKGCISYGCSLHALCELSDSGSNKIRTMTNLQLSCPQVRWGIFHKISCEIALDAADQVVTLRVNALTTKIGTTKRSTAEGRREDESARNDTECMIL